MTIEKIKNGSNLLLVLEGWLDTITSADLNAIVETELDEISSLVMDFEKLEYLTSAGLRVLLTTQQIMEDRGEFIIKNTNDEVMEVLEMTGFSDILTIQ